MTLSGSMIVCSTARPNEPERRLAPARLVVTVRFLKNLSKLQAQLWLLDEGIRLFDHLGTEQIELQRPGVIESPGVTHLRFRVAK